MAPWVAVFGLTGVLITAATLALFRRTHSHQVLDHRAARLQAQQRDRLDNRWARHKRLYHDACDLLDSIDGLLASVCHGHHSLDELHRRGITIMLNRLEVIIGKSVDCDLVDATDLRMLHRYLGAINIDVSPKWVPAIIARRAHRQGRDAANARICLPGARKEICIQWGPPEPT